MIDDAARPGLTTSVRVVAYDGSEQRERVDELATEEPLEIRIGSGSHAQRLAITMRTPGNDFELAAGFLLSEGVITAADQIATISYCTDAPIDRSQQYNVVTVQLHDREAGRVERLQRHFTISSACGICGRDSIEALQRRAAVITDELQVERRLIATLPQKMRDAQRVFETTGGLHAAALFSPSGELLALREDVGRHNAVDKIVGWAILERNLPLRGSLLLVSGRASYELVQKSLVAGIPILCAVSAPSSLAVDLARAFNLTLVGFLRGDRANVYSAAQRVVNSG